MKLDNLKFPPLRLTATTSLAMAVIIAGLGQPAHAQFPTNPYHAPLYWDSYGYQNANNAPMNEALWQRQIPWVSQNFLPYGYNMVCTDGWIEWSTQLNPNGYVLKHNDNWTMKWSDMAAYAKSYGLKLGVYYNPWWVSPTAVNNPTQYTVAGTNIRVANIVDQTYNAGGSPPGDRMNTGHGDANMWWVNAEANGAEQYVKGYIDFFASQGVTYLRVDFLSWYETGMDKGSTIGKTNRPHQDYVNMLKWTREECDKDGIFLSLVMPSLFMQDGSYSPGNPLEGYNERLYGHMVRVDEDMNGDYWWKFSDANQGKRLPYWSQFSNPIDGFTYWSRYSGAGNIILDGDFTQLNTASDDNARKTIVSLQILAGGPVAIADLDSNIGGSAWVYQNSELTALNQQGFVGKPLQAFKNPSSPADPTDPNQYTSIQYWAGKASNGDTIVGMFNRTYTTQTRSVNFSTDLALSGSVPVHDMWSHQDLGQMTSYSTSLPPFGCAVLRLGAGSGGGGQVGTPTFSPAAGSYSTAQAVTIADATAGATIYYTTDGTTPSTNSTRYTGAIQVAKTTTINAIATASGMATSNVGSATYTITIATVPTPPANLTAIAGNGQATLSWTSSSGATSYNVYRGASSGGEASTPVATGVTTSTYTNSGLTNGTTYYYKVAAVNNVGTSAMSNEASATPAASTSTVPIGHCIAIYSAAAAKYATNVTSNSDTITANSTTAGTAQFFNVVDAGGGKVALLSIANRLYVSNNLNSSDKLMAQFASTIGSWETFSWGDLGSGNFSLYSAASNKYVSCNVNGSNVLMAQFATTVGSWETLKWVDEGAAK